MIQVYVAGPYSGKGEDPTLDLLKNIKVGITRCLHLIQHEFAPVCPWLDFLYGIGQGIAPTKEQYRNVSMEHLRRSDALYARNEDERTHGVIAEIQEAASRNIPVVFTFEELCDLRTDIEKQEAMLPRIVGPKPIEPINTSALPEIAKVFSSLKENTSPEVAQELKDKMLDDVFEVVKALSGQGGLTILHCVLLGMELERIRRSQ